MKYVILGVVMSIALSIVSFILFESLDAISWGVGFVLMAINIWVWWKLYQKISKQPDQLMFWTVMMAGKFLLLGILVFALPKLFSLDILSFGVGIFIVAISGICASVGLAKRS